MLCGLALMSSTVTLGSIWLDTSWRKGMVRAWHLGYHLSRTCGHSKVDIHELLLIFQGWHTLNHYRSISIVFTLAASSSAAAATMYSSGIVGGSMEVDDDYRCVTRKDDVGICDVYEFWMIIR